MEDICLLKQRLGRLSEPDIMPGDIYHLLYDLSRTALTAVSIAVESPQAKEKINLYLTRLSHVRTALAGDDLQEMGITPGPKIKEILHHLLIARLNGQVSGRQDEEEMVKKNNTVG